MDVCTRCKEETNWHYICRNCGTKYCIYCSTMSDSRIARGEKPTTNCATDICPSCGREAGEER